VVSTVIIPQDLDVLIEVLADGYKPWRLVDQPDYARDGALRLHSDEKREMTVRLIPE
jgi:hypothetical protein